MPPFLATYSATDDWQEAVDQALERLPGDPPGALGFLYLTDAFAPNVGEIVERLRQRTGVPHWCGTVAGGICASGLEHYDTPALSLLITDLPEERFRLLPSLEANPAGALADQRDWLRRHHPHVGVVHGDPRNPTSAQRIQQLAHSLEAGFLVGGISSGRSGHFLQIADHVIEGGVSGVLFSERVALATGLTHGCHLVGERVRITEVEGNVLRRLGGRPALEVLFDAVGEELTLAPQQMEGQILVALFLPGSDTGDFLIRNLMRLDLSQKSVTIGDLPETGTYLQFARRDRVAAQADLERMAREMKARVPDPKGALYYSCCGRGRHLFGGDSEELRTLRRYLGDLPLTGFFANGEVHHDQLHGYSGVLAIFPGD